MIEDVHFDAGPHERGADVGLQVREAEHQVRPQLDDAVELRARECRDLRLLLACPRRTHGEAGDADDAPVLTEQVQGLGRLLGEAHDAFRKAAGARVGHPKVDCVGRGRAADGIMARCGCASGASWTACSSGPPPSGPGRPPCWCGCCAIRTPSSAISGAATSTCAPWGWYTPR